MGFGRNLKKSKLQTFPFLIEKYSALLSINKKEWNCSKKETETVWSFKDCNKSEILFSSFSHKDLDSAESFVLNNQMFEFPSPNIAISIIIMIWRLGKRNILEGITLS